MKVKTAAKINLNLSIQNPPNPKLHKLDSLIFPITLYDKINIHKANGNRDNKEFTNKNN